MMVHCGSISKKICWCAKHRTTSFTLYKVLYCHQLFVVVSVSRRCVAKKKFHYYYLPASQAWYNHITSPTKKEFNCFCIF